MGVEGRWVGVWCSLLVCAFLIIGFFLRRFNYICSAFGQSAREREREREEGRGKRAESECRIGIDPWAFAAQTRPCHWPWPVLAFKLHGICKLKLK